MTPLHLSLFGALSTALILGIYDHSTGLMPNVLTYGSLLGALLLRSLMEGLEGTVIAGVGLVVVACPPAFMYFTTRGQAIGGGDVKALAALGAWLGPGLGLEVELLSFLFLALHSLITAARTSAAMSLLRRSLSLFLPRRLRSNLSDTGQSMTFVRFGPFLAAGTLAGTFLALVSQAEVFQWLS